MFSTPVAAPRAGVSGVTALYLICGGIVAASPQYCANLHAAKPAVSAILATLLRPLLLVGINLHLH